MMLEKKIPTEAANAAAQCDGLMIRFIATKVMHSLTCDLRL